MFSHVLKVEAKMNKVVFWLMGALFLTSCGARLPDLHVPGNPDELGNVYEAVVALVHEENENIRGSYCTATYVSPRLLATAAHCVPAVNRVTLAPGITVVLPGSSNQSPVGQSVSFIEHQHYSEWVGRDDEDENHPVLTHATVVVVDDADEHDVALLELTADEPDAEHWLEMRNLTNEPLRAGEVAYSVGMPVGQIWILTEGIISRVHIRLNNTIDILHQVRMGPGSSGSALMDARGRMIGVNSAGWGTQSSGIVLGQAKPINYIQTMIRVLEGQREIEQMDRNFRELIRENA